MPYKIVEPIIDYQVRNLCTRKYPNHPKGCPNYGKKVSCPPQCEKIKDILNLKKPVYIIWNKFHLADHIARMKDLHPFWSWRQLVCCLYWQQGARKQLEREIVDFNLDHSLLYQIILRIPEARGVNVTETMKSIGEILEWPPKTKTYQVALVGTKI